MWLWLLRRLGQVVPTLLILSLLVFALQQLMPGDPALILAGEERGDPQVLAQIRSLGSNLLLVLPGSVNVGGVRLGTGGRQNMTWDDVRAIERDIAADWRGKIGEYLVALNDWNKGQKDVSFARFMQKRTLQPGRARAWNDYLKNRINRLAMTIQINRIDCSI